MRTKVGRGIDRTGPLGFRVWTFDGSNSGRMPRAHAHADFELNYLSQGLMRYVFAGREISVTAGKLALFWGSIPHQGVETSPDARGVWATIPLSLLLSWNLPRKLDERMLRGEIAVCGADDECAALNRWVADFKSKDPEMRRTLMLEMEARIRRLAQESPARSVPAPIKQPEPGIESALAFLHAHYLEDIHVEDTSAAAGWHPKYLMRRFKKTFNMPVGEYLMRLRISHAQWLLISTDKTMLDIAFDSGYQSLAPFYQAFRRVANGATPLKFRKNARIGAE